MIHELKEALIRKQDKNASFEANLRKSPWKLRKFFSSFTFTNKRSAKFLDFVVFIKKNNSTF